MDKCNLNLKKYISTKVVEARNSIRVGLTTIVSVVDNKNKLKYKHYDCINNLYSICCNQYNYMFNIKLY